MNDIDDIKQKAYDLAESIAQHPIAIRYFSLLEQMNEDEEAQQLLTRLVNHGKKLNTMAEAGDTDIVNDPDSIELRNAIIEKPLVKEFVSAQNEYLGLIKEIMEILHTRLNP
ncbi:MAG TPA: YlbF family regulator [Spirochaetota bacterium]|nr:YlbF family regulator [Spirochaetota bacterium]HOM88423.1 YlbF family regulator [Spirochaetota bacterium]HPD05941.1 YlbF family regulator [Spirochaetota bacterium]HPK45868.1 YlbF family regulator [Spirochaetota bacterium]HQG43707.1 YlbF family regulator [Spirochaetota bacterium]